MAGTGDKNSKIKRFDKVGILAGGPSSERDISLESGKAVDGALRRNGFNSVLIDVNNCPEEDLKTREMDAAFIALHGGFGEDGTVQKILEDLRIPYTGSGPGASRLALDKIASRIIFQRIGISVPRYKVWDRREGVKLDGLKMPLVVKPQKEGSSIGLSVVSDIKDMKNALCKALNYGDKILIEEYIKGRELTVGIFDDEPLPVVEIISEKGCYDYHAKYESPTTEYLVPAPMKKSSLKNAQSVAVRAHKALGCRFFSRVDIILGDDGRIYVLEVNTIPGLTSRSLLPKAAEAAGISFCDLCKGILEDARTERGVLRWKGPKRRTRKSKSRKSH